MNIAAILKPHSVRCDISAGSKKHALDLLSAVLADTLRDVSAGVVLEGLSNRERLGSTGLGRAVAMPHAKVSGVDGITAAFLRLAEPIEFGAADGQPVDLLFGILVPEESPKPCLAEISTLVKQLRDPMLQTRLRRAEDPASLRCVLVDNLASADEHH